jgi:integrase
VRPSVGDELLDGLFEWINENPALTLKPPKATSKPTLPFSRAEMNKIFDACHEYRGDKARMKAFVLLMRYSGLRRGDTIARDAVTGKNLQLYTQKTGQPVHLRLPNQVVEALGKVEGDGEYRQERLEDRVRQAWKLTGAGQADH